MPASKLTGVFTSAFASRSDDSTYLLDARLNGATRCCCPTAISTGATPSWTWAASYKLLSWLKVYAQAENLTDNQHIAPIGYPSLPFNIRTGLRIEWTRAARQ